ncbi:MAG: FeoB-associated Cys-rich membrane protein [Candidatus Methanomethylophilaceae archaeon]|nr:FeoB-associated Cys-rich membrane protein [Candidatus Methanomethylophilaceae archaeon]
MTVGSMIVLGIVIAVLAGAVYILIRDHRSGKCSCGCECDFSCCGKCIEIEDEKE